MAEGRKSSGGGRRRSSSSGRSRSSSSSGRKSGSSSARSSSARASSARSRSSSSSSAGSRKRKQAAKKGGQARGRQQTARKRARQAGAAAAAPAQAADFSGKTVADLREAIARGVIVPLNLVMLTRERIEEVVGDAASRGRMTRDDAQNLVEGLVSLGRKQTNDVLRDLEQLLGRSRDEVESRTGEARRIGSEAATRARKAADPLIAQADRARRAAGVGASFPVSGYDDLSAAQVQSRLATLTPAELRKVRDYERRHANRKSVLGAIESKLS